MTEKNILSEPSERVLCPYCDGPIRVRRVTYEDMIVTPDGEDTEIVVECDEFWDEGIGYGLHCSGCNDWVDGTAWCIVSDPSDIPELIEKGRLKLAAPPPVKKKKPKKKVA